jgi:hypothetical protein
MLIEPLNHLIFWRLIELLFERLIEWHIERLIERIIAVLSSGSSSDSSSG